MSMKYVLVKIFYISVVASPKAASRVFNTQTLYAYDTDKTLRHSNNTESLLLACRISQ